MLTFIRLHWREIAVYGFDWAWIIVLAVVLLMKIAAPETAECLFHTLPWEPC